MSLRDFSRPFSLFQQFWRVCGPAVRASSLTVYAFSSESAEIALHTPCATASNRFPHRPASAQNKLGISRINYYLGVLTDMSLFESFAAIVIHTLIMSDTHKFRWQLPFTVRRRRAQLEAQVEAHLPALNRLALGGSCKRLV